MNKMKDTKEENKPEESPKKIKHIKVSYNIDSFSDLIDYHESKAISDAFFIAFAIIAILSLMDEYIGQYIVLIMAFMYRFYYWQTKRNLTKPDWEETTIEEKEEK